ncbi:unnamed protein product [Dracunculus medinensis]|uniref:WD_REPEATS_REGION domain-containing protein n=1 Tax=Dracunculus medinensis TaxID=318479 RepID=A0A0N4UDI3_DRAME|nr:unnamed protein product [Dracunculus medinensis]
MSADEAGTSRKRSSSQLIIHGDQISGEASRQNDEYEESRNDEPQVKRFLPLSLSSGLRNLIEPESERATPLDSSFIANDTSNSLQTDSKTLTCRVCISAHLENHSLCPICRKNLLKSSKLLISPNITVAEATETLRAQIEISRKYGKNRPTRLYDDNGNLNELLNQLNNLDSESLDHVISFLNKRRLEIGYLNKKKKARLLRQFMDQMIARRENIIKQAELELKLIKSDKIKMEMNTNFLDCNLCDKYACHSSAMASYSAFTKIKGDNLSVTDGDGLLSREDLHRFHSRLSNNFSNIEQLYFNKRNNDWSNSDGMCEADLNDFSDMLYGVIEYEKFNRLAVLDYNSCLVGNPLSIVSSIEFDKDEEYFVVAGVTNKINIYDYNSIVEVSHESIRHPIMQLTCPSKISNVAWNPFIKSMLVNSDYEGNIHIWDTKQCKDVKFYKEHQRRCWSVEFNQIDPHIMASGSDDAKVKLWSLNCSRSIATIEAKVNVCSVHFSPMSRHNLAFGSADHCVHLYDTRNISKAVNILRGHRKAVSYVKYCNENELVSASTDSNLRLWDVSSGKCIRIMKGHQNERNFAGLATNGRHIACGSEDNQLFLYYKGLTDPILRYDFSFAECVPLSVDSANDFVSAVCWKKKSNVIVAANSRGIIQILEVD